MRSERRFDPHPGRIEKVFTQCVMDLQQAIVLDRIEMFPDNMGFRLRCHDMQGALPEIVIESSSDAKADEDRLGSKVCKLVAISRLRAELVRFLPGARLLSPTIMDGQAIVGLKVEPKTWLAEGENSLATYHQLHGKILGDPAAGPSGAGPD